jgi:hypothetical protein
MAGNTDPIFSKAGDVSTNNSTTVSQAILTAANDFTGAGANNVLVFTAGANGAYVQRLRLKAAGTNVASVMRIFINNGSIHTTAANNTFYGEIALPITTSNAVGITAPDLDYPLNFALNASFTIWVGLGTTVAAGWFVTAIAGQY